MNVKQKDKGRTTRLAFFTRDLSPEELVFFRDFLILLKSNRPNLPNTILSPDAFTLLWPFEQPEPTNSAVITANLGETRGP